jgi:hypothetical protein
LVQWAALRQLIVLALSYNLPIIHHYYHICGNNSAESVGDYKTGSILHNFLNGIVNFGFAVGIDLTCCLIENQDWGVLQNRPGYDNSL